MRVIKVILGKPQNLGSIKKLSDKERRLRAISDILKDEFSFLDSLHLKYIKLNFKYPYHSGFDEVLSNVC